MSFERAGNFAEDVNCEVVLTPNATLNLNRDSFIQVPQIQKAFSSDWREGWFEIAASKFVLSLYPALRFWQSISHAFLTKLCHLPEEAEFSFIASEDQWFDDWIANAPPLTGGEYLSVAVLEKMWGELNAWVREASERYEGVHVFLRERAPKWQQVGRVCFHLAENKNHPDRPFAFLATYATGFNASGQLKHLPLKKAIEQYAGDNNRDTLIKLLTPVQKGSEKCSWLKKILGSMEVYQTLVWSIAEAYELLKSVQELEECGLIVRIPNWWRQRVRPQVSVTIDSNQSSVGVDALLNFDVQVALGGQILSENELRELLRSEEKLISIRGEWVEVDSQKLQEALTHWNAIKHRSKNGTVSFIEGMRLLSGAPSDLQNDAFIEEHRPWVAINAGNALAQTLRNLRDPSNISSEEGIKNLNAVLRPYQKEGVNWLSLLVSMGLGACLADDMGLGKTIQILSLLLIQQERSKTPSLLIVPASLLGNWRREAERFAPSLKLIFLHSSEIDAKILASAENSPEDFFASYQLVVTTYSMVARQSWLSKVAWKLVILDEAQAIKNAGTKQSRMIKKLQSEARIALKGTPIENRLGDLWSLFDFINPGLLGTSTRFKSYIKNLQSGEGQFKSLKQLVSPYILRRMKNDPKIISDLPEKMELSCYCELTKAQAKAYQCVVEDLKQSLKNVEQKARRGIVLSTLLRLKQICNHISHFNGEGNYHPALG